MIDKRKGQFPKWLFAVLAFGSLIAAGIYIGIMSIDGITRLHLVQAAGFSIFGLLMLWGALRG
jgi:hypothetical protein